MELTHRFTVPAPVEETWAAFNDLESVAGCFPGATVTSVEGDDFKGSCKVKLGPISLVYTGSGTFTERDEAAHRLVMEAKGKDKRGNGTAGATVTAVLSSAAPASTDVEVVTDLAITGKPAQFGRGMMQDVSDKLLGQFVACLESKVGAGTASADTGAASADTGAASADTTTASADTGIAVADSGFAARPSGEEMPVGGAADVGDGQPRDIGATARKAPATAYSGASAGAGATGAPSGGDQALDLGAMVLPALLKAYWKPLAGGLLGLLLLRKLLRRRS